MEILTKILPIILISYGLGSLMGAFYIVKYFLGEDIRNIESGNVGATNAGRVLGKKGFLLTLVIDVCKVLVALTIVYFWADTHESYLVLSSFFVLLGHLYPVQLQFRGGKGVVVYFAAALFLTPISIPISAVTMCFSYFLFRRYTLSGFISMGSIPVAAFLLEESVITPLGLLTLFVVVIFAHKKK
ncbi:glycerol-3-phosphate acyltransferase [Bacillus sp. 2205SS5-2]|uniref:glycerol-3-phosphate acyltransferase n=1 Tax=Bacillus sp. 2205SS5-2 TaxID=3109031 RepID=UPI0030049385